MTTNLAALVADLGLVRVRGPTMTAGVEELDRVLVTGVTVDSRRAASGVVFCACPGATPRSSDGHAYLAAAVAAGAAALVVRDAAVGAPFAERVPVFVATDARRVAAVMAERACGEPSRRMRVVGVTGTNGKTTATWLIAQLCARAGRKSAVLGTLGVGPIGGLRPLGHTTPEAEVVSAELARLAADGVEVVAMEVSSHALATARVDGIHFAVAAFTNITRDHLDFHGSMDVYFEAKARLFSQLAAGRPAVIPAVARDDDATRFVERLRQLAPGATRWGVGGDLVADELAFDGRGTRGVLEHRGTRVPFTTALLGDTNVENVLVAVGSALALGLPLVDVAAALATVRPPPGRFERVGDGAPLAVVDYAHTPDALERALHTMRRITTGTLTVVFGCGGDRDAGKRPLMGAVAAACADAVVVTDDNPRSEDGDRICAAIEAGVSDRLRRAERPAALTRGTWTRLRWRRSAIRAAIAAAGPDDAVLIAGKGHEKTQTIGARVLPFDDVTEASRALHHESAPAFLDGAFVVRALAGRGARVEGALPGVFVGVGTDSRAVERGQLFVALRGERFDGHDFVVGALADGAGAALVEAERAPPAAGPAIIVDDTLLALQDLARAHLASLPARRVALTGSNGKTTTKELIAACLRAALGEPFVHATEGNLNNHIGVPLTALRAEVDHAALVFEMGMNHSGEIATLADIARPHIGLITNIGTAHAGNVGGVEGVARAKAELFAALPKDGVALVNADDPRCVREAQAHARCRQISFGRAAWADVRLLGARDRAEGGQEIELQYGAERVEVTIPLDGRHNAVNATGAVAVGVALGLPFKVCALGLAGVRGAHGRLERFAIGAGPLRGAWVLDDTYNANPDSMEAAFATLGELAGARRKVVVLGEMRELGSFAPQAHLHIGAAAAQSRPALILCCGEDGRLYGDGAVRAGFPAASVVWARDSSALAPMVVARVAADDVVLVKGSRGARMEIVVEALRKTEAR